LSFAPHYFKNLSPAVFAELATRLRKDLKEEDPEITDAEINEFLEEIRP
jgi:hypothetical protein